MGTTADYPRSKNYGRGGRTAPSSATTWSEQKRAREGRNAAEELLPAGGGSALPTGRTSLSPAEVTAAYQLDAAKKALAAGNDAAYSRRIVLYRGAQDQMNNPVRVGGSARALTIVDSTGQATNVVTATRERYRAETPEQMRRLGVSAPGVYELTRVENRPVQRQFYEDFGTGQRVPVDRSNRFAYSPSPLLSTQVENVAGLGPKMETTRTVERRPGLVRSGLAVTETTITPQSGAQAQLLAAGLNRVTGKGSTDPFATSPAPFVARLRQEETLKGSVRQGFSDRWDRAMDTGGWRFLRQELLNLGASSEYYGGLTRRAGEQNPGRFGAVQRGVGRGVEYLGQFYTGMEENIRERPAIAARDIAIAAAGGYAARGLGFAAATGSARAAYGLWALKGTAAFGVGYWGASEADAIRKSERPGARFSQTAFELGAFGVGNALVSGAWAIPEQRTVRYTNQRNVVTERDGGLYGKVTRRGYVEFERQGLLPERRVVSERVQTGTRTVTRRTASTEEFLNAYRDRIEVIKLDFRRNKFARYAGFDAKDYGVTRWNYLSGRGQRVQIFMNTRPDYAGEYASTLKHEAAHAQIALSGGFRQAVGTAKFNRVLSYKTNAQYKEFWLSNPSREARAYMLNAFEEEAVFAAEANPKFRFKITQQVPVYGRVTRVEYVPSVKSYRVPFTATETYRGDVVEGRVVYRGGTASSYRGSLVRITPETQAFTPSRAPAGRNVLFYEQKVGGRTLGGSEYVDLTRVGYQGQTGAGYDVLGSTFPGQGGQGQIYGGVRDGRGVVSVIPAGRALPTRGIFLYQPEAVAAFQPSAGFAPAEAAGLSSPAPAAIFSPGVPALPLGGFAARGLATPSVVTVFGGLEVQRSQPMVVSVQQVGVASQARAGSSTLSTSLVRVGALAGSQSFIEPVVDAGVSPLTQTRALSESSPAPSVYTGPSWDFLPPEPVPPTPWGEPGVPGWGFGAGRKSFARSGRAGFRSRYNPSLVATVLDIRGSRREGGLAAMTGVAVRPIV